MRPCLRPFANRHLFPQPEWLLNLVHPPLWLFEPLASVSRELDERLGAERDFLGRLRLNATPGPTSQP